MHRRSGFAFLLVAVVGAFGCSDSHSATSGRSKVGSLSCGSSSCGGDIAGRWEIAGACAEGAEGPFIEECEGSSLKIRDLSVEGEFVFEAGGAGTTDLSTDIEVRASIPDSCLMGLSCDQVQDALRDGDFDGRVSCGRGGGGCRCDLRLASSESDTFTWERRGEQLVIDSESWDYCVEDGAAMVRQRGEDDGFELTVLLERSG